MEKSKHIQDTYWSIVWKEFRRHHLGLMSLRAVLLFALAGIYAPFLASSKPLFVYYEGQAYFPLFANLFYRGFFTKRLDIFYNLLMFTLPLFVVSTRLKGRARVAALLAVCVAQLSLFLYFSFGPVRDPGSDPHLNHLRQEALLKRRPIEGADPLLQPIIPPTSWAFDLQFMTQYAKLDQIVRLELRREQDHRLQAFSKAFHEKALQRYLTNEAIRRRIELSASGISEDKLPDIATLQATISRETPPEALQEALAMPTLWRVERANEDREIQRAQATLDQLGTDYGQAKAALQPLIDECNRLEQSLQTALADKCEEIRKASARQRSALAEKRQIVERYEGAKASIAYILDRRTYLEGEALKLKWRIMPLIRPFHWEDDAGGEQSLNAYIGAFERTRVNRKDLVSALLFGIRISLVVGLLSVFLAISIGIPVGSLAGYYGGKFDIIVSRLLEIWESMPTFFMLLLVVAVTQSKSIFLVIAVIGLFGWTSFSRYMRGEVFKQRNLAYVEACHALGFKDRRIIFGHILPNAIPPLLTLLPFAVMGAITSEAGLSFLGLGEEGSCSWGVLMDEGRSAFPGESYLLWPPAILLTALLIAIALVGDALRDSLDPKLRRG